MNVLIAIVGPSGVGKSTLIKKIQKLGKEIHDEFNLLTTATTRTPRDGEVEGVHHYFLSVSEFEKRIKNGDFIEYSKPHGNYYGVLRDKLEDQLHESNLLKDIDFSGADNLKRALGTGTVMSVLVLPPNKAELIKRLEERNASPERLANVDKSIADLTAYVNSDLNTPLQSEDMLGSTLRKYDLIVVNDNVEECAFKVINYYMEQYF